MLIRSRASLSGGLVVGYSHRIQVDGDGLVQPVRVQHEQVAQIAT
jgi:hypothetical protein